jgi:hypothetical protein
MNRQPSRQTLVSLAGVAVAATAFASACTPKNNPPPGPPVLTQAIIVENGSAATVITPDTGDCGAAVMNSGACDPAMDTICRDTAGSNWCRCVMYTAPTPDPDAGATDAAPPPPGNWNCDPFAANSGVLYVFDRLLDTDPLGDGKGGVTTVASSTLVPTPTNPITAGTDYASNGTQNEVIFPLLGTLRVDGPSLFVTGQPTGKTRPPVWAPWLSGLPVSTTVTITLDKTQVLAKDGTSSFTATGLLVDGSITYTTNAVFTGTLTVPTPADPDGGVSTVPPDKTPAVATFTSPVDPAQIKLHTTVTATPAGGTAAPLVFEVVDVDGLDVNIVAWDPNMVPPAVIPWPADTKIDIAIDATAASVAGDTIGMPLSGTFTTSAM